MSWKNREKFKTFSIPIENEAITTDKDGNENMITISYKRKFVLIKENLLIVEDLWQLIYQILLVISEKEFTRLNVKIVIVFFKMKASRII